MNIRTAADPLDDWARRPGPAKLIAEARRRLEAGHAGDRVSLQVELDRTEVEQVGRLLGLRWQTAPVPVTLGRLRAAAASAGGDLEELLIRNGGELRNRSAERDAARHARQQQQDAAFIVLTAAGIKEQTATLARTRRWLGRPGVDDLTARAQELGRLWQMLPAQGRLLAELASALYGDPHALDRDSDLGRLAARVLAVSSDPAGAAAAADGALAAETWRSLWEGVGVHCDEVSSTVLVLNLRLVGTSPAAALAAATAGEPVWLTARSLRGQWAPQPGLTHVRVCENPAVVEAAANSHAAAAGTLVCTYGRPSAAAWTLLRRLAAAGIQLLISADRDRAGRQFTAEMLTLPGAQQWLAAAEGLYEEDRLDMLVADLAPQPSNT